MKFAVIEQQHGEVKSYHKTLELANKKLESIDTVYSASYSDDVNWLTGYEEALIGYKYRVIAASEVEEYIKDQLAFFTQ